MTSTQNTFYAHELFSRMESGQIVLAYRGNITEELLNVIFQFMESKSENEEQELRVRKKFNNILVECLQNVYHHMNRSATIDGKAGLPDSAVFFVCKDKDNGYRIVTGNPVANSQVEGFRQQIEKINSMNPEELKSYYRESLSKSTFSEKGGAGLGLIDMARKSGHQLGYRFDPMNDEISFFSLEIRIT